MKCVFFDSPYISFSRYAHLIWEGFKCGCMFQIPRAPTRILATDWRVEEWQTRNLVLKGGKPCTQSQ